MATAVLAATAGGSAAAGPRVIDVHPGPGAISKAIAAARAGDTLRIDAGTYHEALTVDKPLTLEASGRKNPVVDAGCQANDAIHVTTGAVTVSGLTVKGAASGFGDYPAEIFFEGTRTGTIRGDRVIDSCDAEYGISVFDAGPVTIRHNYARGFDDSGIYIGTIVDTRGRALRALRNISVGNSRGIIVEDSNSPAQRIVIKLNLMNDNRIPGDEGPSDGLFLTNSDRVRAISNLARGNAANGYHPNATSDRNVFLANSAPHNGGRQLLDEGRGNCGRGNSFSIPAC